MDIQELFYIFAMMTLLMISLSACRMISQKPIPKMEVTFSPILL